MAIGLSATRSAAGSISHSWKRPARLWGGWPWLVPSWLPYSLTTLLSGCRARFSVWRIDSPARWEPDTRSGSKAVPGRESVPDGPGAAAMAFPLGWRLTPLSKLFCPKLEPPPP